MPCPGREHAARYAAQLTTSLVCTYGRIVIEDLNVKGMVRNRRLGRAVSDMGLGEFRRQLASRRRRRSRKSWWLIGGFRQASHAGCAAP